jgi:outer membrane protein assembly factor BamB
LALAALVRLAFSLTILAWVPPPWVAGTAEAAQGVDWGRFHYDLANTGHNPHETILSPDNVSQLTVDWQVHTGHVFGGMAVANGVVYVGSWDEHVYAFDAATGALRWKTWVRGDIQSVPAVVGRALYVSAGTGVFALKAASGEILWRHDIRPTPSSSPMVANGVVYVGSYENALYALDAKTGATIWVGASGGIVYSTPAMSSGRVYAGGWDGFAYAFDAGTGETLWKVELGDRVASSPTVVGDVVFVTSRSDEATVHALNAETGSVLWQANPRPGFGLDFPPVVANDVVYIGGSDGVMYAFNAVTGEILWSTELGWWVTSGAIANGVLYAASLTFFGHGAAWAIDAATGEVLWSDKQYFWIGGSPAVVNGQVFFPSDGRIMTAYGLP